MALNIARQPLVPAFLTLVALTVAAMWQLADVPSATELQPTLALLPANTLSHFQATHPSWSRLLAGLMMLYSGLCLGRISTRYGLYGASSCLAIPLYGIVCCGMLPHADYLMAFSASLLLTLSTQSFCRSYRSDYAFDPIFRAALYLGLIPFVYPPALPLVLLLSFAIRLFRRTLREVTVALAGILLPALIVCYVAWGQGSDFTAPLVTLWNTFLAGELLQFFFTASLPVLGFLGVVALPTIASIFLFVSTANATGNRPRQILSYNISMLLLTAGLLATPSATYGVSALFAIPIALSLPVLFVRIRHAIATPIYLILLVSALIRIFVL